MKLIQQDGQESLVHTCLYVVCPLLTLLLACLPGLVSEGFSTHTLYGGIILAALPTWNRRFLSRLAVGSSFLILLAEIASHNRGTATWLDMADASIGLLVIWGAVQLSRQVISTHERHVRKAIVRAKHAANCHYQWRGRMLTMCAWSKQLKDGGSWVPIEEFFSRHFHIRVSHGVCEQIRDGLINPASASGGVPSAPAP